jgi:hypothetical protein
VTGLGVTPGTKSGFTFIEYAAPSYETSHAPIATRTPVLSPEKQQAPHEETKFFQTGKAWMTQAI